MTISIDLRERIIASYDAGEGIRKQIAERFKVSEDFVKKLLKQRNKLGHIKPLPKGGSKPKFQGEILQELKEFVESHPDATLEEINEAFSDRVNCVIQTIHNTLKKLGFSYKKNSSCKRTRTGRCSRTEKNLERMAKRS